MPPMPESKPQRCADQPQDGPFEKHGVPDLAGGGPGAGQHAELFFSLAYRDGEGVVDHRYRADYDQQDHDPGDGIEHGHGLVVLGDAQILQELVIVSIAQPPGGGRYLRDPVVDLARVFS